MGRHSDVPINVRVLDTAGREWPVQVLYLGSFKGDRPSIRNIWTIVDAPPDEEIVGLAVDYMPSRTTIDLAFTLSVDSADLLAMGEAS